MTSVSALESLQSSLAYHFQNARLLEEALTHKSYVNEQKAVTLPHNERMEFLGDAVLGMVICEHLYQHFPDRREGQLHRRSQQAGSARNREAGGRRLQMLHLQ